MPRLKSCTGILFRVNPGWGRFAAQRTKDYLLLRSLLKFFPTRLLKIQTAVVSNHHLIHHFFFHHHSGELLHFLLSSVNYQQFRPIRSFMKHCSPNVGSMLYAVPAAVRIFGQFPMGAPHMPHDPPGRLISIPIPQVLQVLGRYGVGLGEARAA
jgi:hypothetical protein